jgi:hypothetical protein
MDVHAQHAGAQRTTTTLSWRALLAGITAVMAAGYLVYSATLHEFPPAGIVYGLLMLLAAWLVRRSGGRVAIGFAGALHAFELYTNLFVYGGPAKLANPSAWQDFLVAVFFILGTAAGTVAAVGAWRSR